MPALTESSPTTEAPAKLRRRDRTEMHESGMHGRGVYAVIAITCGKKIIGYKGEHITQKEVLRRHPHGPSDPDHAFYFSLENGSVVDAKYGGSHARWINHACKPNREAREADGRMFIRALRDIEVGEELFHDYGLVIEGRQTKALKEQFAYRCGARKYRDTMLAPPERTKKR